MSTCTSTPSTRSSRPRCAAMLVALARAGYVQTAHLNSLGRVLLGRDLNAPRWRLPGVGKIHPRRGVVAGALRAALAMSLTPRRVRLGTAWVKDGSGQVAESCVPADLPPPALAQYLRSATFGIVRAAVLDRQRPLREERLPDGFETDSSPLASEHSNQIAMGPEAHLIAEQTLGEVLALAGERGRVIVRLRIAGFTSVEIARRTGVTDRTVRRHLQALHERAATAGILDSSGHLPS